MKLIFTIIQGLIILLVSPAVLGTVRLFKARLQTRRGPSIFLPYWSLLSLLKKEMTISKHSSWVFKTTPFVVAGSAIVLAFVTPTFFIGGYGSAYSNVFLLTAILMMGAVFLVLGGMDVASTFGGMGSAREMTLATLGEPVLFLIFATLGAAAKSWSLDGIQNVFLLTPWYVLSPFLFLTIVALTCLVLAENARYPVDNPATHLELTMVHEAMILEYSGPYLALLEYAGTIKLTVLSLVLMNVLAPWFLATSAGGVIGIIVALAAMIVKLALAAGLIAIIESVMAKMRFYRMQEYMAFAFFVGLAGFALLIFFPNLI